jgi:hypothetical protein
MVTLMLLGLVWVVWFYLSKGGPFTPLHNWNLVFGFGLILVGFGMTARWR